MNKIYNNRKLDYFSLVCWYWNKIFVSELDTDRERKKEERRIERDRQIESWRQRGRKMLREREREGMREKLVTYPKEFVN